MDLEKIDIFLQEGVYGKQKSRKYLELVQDVKNAIEIKTLKDIQKKTEALFKKKLINKDEYKDIYDKIADKNIK